MEYAMNVLAALSQLLNALLFGDCNMTFSARCHVRQDEPLFAVLRPVVDALFWFDDDHCRSSWLRDIEFSHKVVRINNSEN